jgi:hypothetical protein
MVDSTRRNQRRRGGVRHHLRKIFEITRHVHDRGTRRPVLVSDRMAMTSMMNPSGSVDVHLDVRLRLLRGIQRSVVHSLNDDSQLVLRTGGGERALPTHVVGLLVPARPAENEPDIQGIARLRKPCQVVSVVGQVGAGIHRPSRHGGPL